MLRGMSGNRKGRFDGSRRLLQERVFATLYGRGAVVYDRFTDWLFLGEWRRWQESALSFLPATGLVVELGAGTGRFAERAASAERRWIAVDNARPMLAVAARRASNVDYVLADARALPLADGCAEAVVATFPTRYILDPHVAAEVSRVLNADGRLIVVLTGELAPHGWRRRWRRCALALFYGRRQHTASKSFAVLGMRGEMMRRRTAHGWAEVYVATIERTRG